MTPMATISVVTGQILPVAIIEITRVATVLVCSSVIEPLFTGWLCSFSMPMLHIYVYVCRKCLPNKIVMQ
jgi:hypothetical protein